MNIYTLNNTFCQIITFNPYGTYTYKNMNVTQVLSVENCLLYTIFKSLKNKFQSSTFRST